MADVHEVNDAYIGLGRLLTVQPPDVLLQGPLSRDRHCKGKGVNWRMIEAFADEATTRKENSRVIGSKGVERVEVRCTGSGGRRHSIPFASSSAIRRAFSARSRSSSGTSIFSVPTAGPPCSVGLPRRHVSRARS